MADHRNRSLHRPLDERLRERAPRTLDRVKDPIVRSPTVGMSLHSPSELAAVAVGLLVLRSVEEHGRTRLHERAIEDALQRATGALTAEEVMRLEVEAYEILDWLLGDDRPIESRPEIAHVDDGAVVYEPEAQVIELVREAIFQGFDLKIDYFSRRRGEMNTRVITPVAIGADRYIRAWCHARRAERIFRLERIRRAVPVNGRPCRVIEPERTDPAERADGETTGTTGQMPLFDDV